MNLAFLNDGASVLFTTGLFGSLSLCDCLSTSALHILCAYWICFCYMSLGTLFNCFIYELLGDPIHTNISSTQNTEYRTTNLATLIPPINSRIQQISFHANHKQSLINQLRKHTEPLLQNTILHNMVSKLPHNQFSLTICIYQKLSLCIYSHSF